MSIIDGLDNKRMPTGTGENLHPEHTFSKEKRSIENIRERFVQLFFQMVRVHHKSSTKMKTLRDIGERYASLLNDIEGFGEYNEDIIQVRKLSRALINHTRDCVKGKGERDLAYTLLIYFYESQKERLGMGRCRGVLLAILRYWAKGTKGAKGRTPPPGSWGDIVKFCSFLKEWVGGDVLPGEYNQIIKESLGLLAKQIHIDVTSENPSLASKWAPRESSKKQRWLFYRFVREMMPALEGPMITPVTHPRFLSACKTIRKTVSSLSRTTRTLEIYQCEKRWRYIEPNSVPSIALQKQKKALLNHPRKGGDTTVRSESEDRIVCAHNFQGFLKEVSSGRVKLKADRTSIYDLVRDATSTEDMEPDLELLLEEQWMSNGKQITARLPPMIPMIDVSGSMCCDKSTPLFYAIGLGLRVSERTHPVFRNRVLTFSDKPEWIRLPEPPSRADPCDSGSFIKRVQTIRNAPWGMNTDFYQALNMILDTLVENRVPPSEAKGMVLAVFSDMQIDAAVTDRRVTPQAMHTTIQKMYEEKGYTPPHILYWNLRTTEGFPCVTAEKNVTMLSGFSPVLLNVFQTRGIEALREYTPYRMIIEMLDSSRFTNIKS